MQIESNEIENNVKSYIIAIVDEFYKLELESVDNETFLFKVNILKKMFLEDKSFQEDLKMIKYNSFSTIQDVLEGNKSYIIPYSLGSNVEVNFVRKEFINFFIKKVKEKIITQNKEASVIKKKLLQAIKKSNSGDKEKLNTKNKDFISQVEAILEDIENNFKKEKNLIYQFYKEKEINQFKKEIKPRGKSL